MLGLSLEQRRELLTRLQRLGSRNPGQQSASANASLAPPLTLIISIHPNFAPCAAAKCASPQAFATLSSSARLSERLCPFSVSAGRTRCELSLVLQTHIDDEVRVESPIQFPLVSLRVVACLVYPAH